MFELYEKMKTKLVRMGQITRGLSYIGLTLPQTRASMAVLSDEEEKLFPLTTPGANPKNFEFTATTPAL
jgi:hypothetical protein